jgi:hypothetical protein
MGYPKLPPKESATGFSPPLLELLTCATPTRPETNADFLRNFCAEISQTEDKTKKVKSKVMVFISNLSFDDKVKIIMGIVNCQNNTHLFSSVTKLKFSISLISYYIVSRIK